MSPFSVVVIVIVVSFILTSTTAPRYLSAAKGVDIISDCVSSVIACMLRDIKLPISLRRNVKKEDEDEDEDGASSCD